MIPTVVSERAYSVYADLRWPPKTGIGNWMSYTVQRPPPHVTLVGLKIRGSIGSPLSPAQITRALRNERLGKGVFFNPGFVPPLASSLPSIVTIHDLMHIHFYGRLKRIYYDTVLKFLFARCTAILSVSDYSRNEFVNWSGVDPRKVLLVSEAPPVDFLENSLTLNFPFEYILYAGNRRPYKNLGRLLQAYAASSLPNRRIHLLLTGEPDDELTQKAQQLGVPHLLKFAGSVSDIDMPKLYHGALAVAFVSLYEGFGLPILEAMASRVPIITSNVTSMPEVAGDAAVLVDPYDVTNIASALDLVASDQARRKALVERGLRNLSRFDQRTARDSVWQIIEQVAEGNGPTKL